jgi:hypothetical protein
LSLRGGAATFSIGGPYAAGSLMRYCVRATACRTGGTDFR